MDSAHRAQISRLTAFANTSLNPLPGNVSFANEIIEFMFDQLVVSAVPSVRRPNR